MKIRLTAGAVAGLACLAAAVPAPAAGPADVTVRVEGLDQTLLPETVTRTTTTPVSKDGENSCSGTSAIGALDVAVAGNWSGPYTFSQTVETILGETHAFDPDASANRYWAFWLNHAYQNLGPCETEVQQGDDVLWFPACYGDCSYPTVLSLQIAGTAAPGQPVDARVTEHAVTFDEQFNGTTTSSAGAGATVTAGDRTFTADGAGVARVVLDARGETSAQATKPGSVRSSAEPVCVTDGADGFCGTTKPGQPAAPLPTCATSGDDGLCGTRDRRAPQARLLGIAEQQRFTAGGAPRELRGTVAADPSGLFAVKLRLTRRHRGRCWYFSGRSEAFRRTRCGRSFPFAIGDRADWSYLLPDQLGAGRYVLDSVAIDRAFNRDPLARGRNRIVFHVG